MPLRELCDPNAVVWRVWDVRPAWIAAEQLAGRRPGESRLSVEPGLAAGWLTFASVTGERRRVVPIPEGWDALDDVGLCGLLLNARPVPVRARRLIE
jgi:hypothetical protein